MAAALLSVEILCSILKHQFFNGMAGPPMTDDHRMVDIQLPSAAIFCTVCLLVVVVGIVASEVHA